MITEEKLQGEYDLDNYGDEEIANMMFGDPCKSISQEYVNVNSHFDSKGNPIP
jgi:hypothetical protein